jgi:hypothetical protein
MEIIRQYPDESYGIIRENGIWMKLDEDGV